MTEKTRYPYQEAMKIAAEIQDAMTQDYKHKLARKAKGCRK